MIMIQGVAHMAQRGILLFRREDVPLSPEAAEMRRLVYKQASSDPESFDMTAWERTRDCRTTRCLAGWAEFLQHGRVHVTSSDRMHEQRGIGILELTYAEYYDQDGRPLFYGDDARALARFSELEGVRDDAA